ncbi:TonB-dependent receptor [Sphingomonas sp. MMS12-HWE2-04]|uniref:TonB-dependent receptor n=1 Tax=Sphingomonas sp. MMS12-HWE2-04 TaxID=3234199 RepID=UPI00384A5EB9
MGTKQHLNSVLFAGASILALALAPAVHAQEATPPAEDAAAQDDAQTSAPEDDIVVSGLRQSLQSAQNIKRNSDQFVDSITAQDIGRLPDTNVAEALQRISGVQITRTYGEGNGVAVRGLSQVRTELNGRDIFSASGGRGLSWEELGSDLLAGVDVYKNPSADLIEGGLSGLINLRTRLPFDSAGQVASFTVGSTYYDLIEKSGQQVSGLYSNRWKTGIGEFGILANVSYQTTQFREDNVVVEPFYQHGPNPTNAAGIQTPLPGFANEQVLAPHGGGFKVGYGNRERTSYYGALQWKPAENLEFYGQYFRADYSFRDQGVSFFAYGSDMPPASGRTFTVDDDGIARTGYFSNPNVDSVIFSTGRKTQTTDISGGAKWNVTDRLRITADYQRINSHVNAQTINLTATALNPRTSVAGTGQNYDFYYDISGDIPVFQSSVPGYFGNAANYGMTAILPYAEDNDATSDAFRADLNWDFNEDSLLRNIKVGGRYSDKSAINRNTTYGTWTAIGSTCANWSSDSGCYLLSEFPQYAELNPFQSDVLRGKGASTVFGPVQEFATQLALNPQASFDAVKAISGQTIGFRSFDAPDAFNGTIDEKTYAAYARAGFGATVFGLKLDGNFGLRWVRTQTDANGSSVLNYRTPGSQPVTNPDGSVTAPPNVTVQQPYVGKQDYDKWLPSVNARLYFTNRLLARFAYSKNFSRPSFTQLNPSFTLSPTYTGSTSTPDRLNPNQPLSATNPYVGTGSVQGNPNLKPEQVENFDLAVEWYFDNVGFVYATGFKKNVKDLIDTRNVPLIQEVAGLGPVQFNVSSLVNVSSGFVKGFEVGGQKFFDFLPAPFDGLGVQANYTYVDSDAGVQAAGDINSTTLIKVPLQGLSKHSYNLIALFDKGGFNARLAYNWRGQYLQGTQNTGTQNLPIFGDSYGILDASISYDVTRNFSLTLDGQNLLNTPIKTYQIFDNRPRDYIISDRRVAIRARVRL